MTITKHLKYFMCALLLGAFCFAGLSVPLSQADEILERFNKPLPVVDLMDNAAFVGSTTLYNETPFDDELLAYQLRLPNKWEKINDKGFNNYNFSSHVLGEFARFYSPPNLAARSYFTIDAVGLEYQLSAHQWFLQHVLSNGFALEGIKVYDDNKVEALYVTIIKNVSYIVRAVAHKNGRRMILVQYFVPDVRWNDESKMQAQAIQSFQLKTLKEEIIEEMLKYQFLDLTMFEYPVSWKLRAPPVRSIDRMGIKLINMSKKNSLGGQIDLNLSSSFIAQSLAEEIEFFKKEMEKKGLAFGELIETKEDYIFHDDIDFAIVEVYKANDYENKLTDYEVWFTIMSAGGYYYFVTLLTPARDADFFIWSRNSETYRLVVESITPLEESMIDD